MNEGHDLIDALLSEVAGLLEDAASLAPLVDRAGLAERVDRMADHAPNAIVLLAAVRETCTMGRNGR